MRDELIALLKEKLGENPTPDQVVAFLSDQRVISPWHIRRVLVLHEFPRLLMSSNRTARDIEGELAERYNVSPSTIKIMRVRDAKRKV